MIKNLFEIYPLDSCCTVPLGVCIDELIFATDLTAAQGLGSPMEASDLLSQFGISLARVRECMEQAGSNLDHVARITAYVTKAEDRMQLYEPWEALFPIKEDRPAFKVLVAKLPPGILVRLDLVAILNGRRKRFDIEGVPAHDPTIRIGDWVFTSRVHGTVPFEKVPIAQDKEAFQTIQNLESLRNLANIPSIKVSQITTFGRDTGYLLQAKTALKNNDLAASSQISLVSPIPEHLSFMAEMVANDGKCFEEIYLRPDRDPAIAGLRFGSFIFLPNVAGILPDTGLLAEGGTEQQIRRALSNIEILLKSSSASIEQLTRATFFLSDLNDRPILNQIWSETFPNSQRRPPHKYVKASLPNGQHVSIQAWAVSDSELKVLTIPGLEHQDPMTMGAKNGQLVVSSRLFGVEPYTGRVGADLSEHLALDFAHADALLADAKLDKTALRQVTAFVHDEDSAAAMRSAFHAYGSPHARLNIIETNLGGFPFPRIEILALT